MTSRQSIILSLFTIVAGAWVSACGPSPEDPTVDPRVEPEVEPEQQPEAEPEVQPEPEPVTLQAAIYATDPAADPDRTQVTIAAPTTEDGTLTGAFVNAKNCTNKDGGEQVLGFATLCVEEQTVTPDEEGNYLHVTPPDGDSGEDPFAELQMYHHVNMVHDYFNKTHGFTDLDFPLDAVVNITINFAGTWQSFANAAFMPAETFASFGLPERDYGAIMFGQGDGVDFSYDASVIYHEYTHAVVGTSRLQGAFLDTYGLNNTGGAINEAVADYFAASMLENSLVGAYALGDYARDLTDVKTCPADLTTEVHADGKIVGAALWTIREMLGADIADPLVFGALLSAGLSTGLSQFGQLLAAEADDRLSAAEATMVKDMLTDRGMIGCERVKPWEDVVFANTAEGVPHAVEGNQQGLSLPNGVPGYHQWSLDVPDGQVARLSWTLQGGGLFGGAPSALGLAVKPGAAIEMNGFTGGILGSTLVDAPPMDNAFHQAIEIGGACVPAGGGTTYLTFRNTGMGGSQVVDMAVTFEDAPTGDVPYEDCE